MISNREKFYFDLIAYGIKRERTPRRYERVYRHYPRAPRARYFFDKVIAENRKEFDLISVRKELRKVLSKGCNEIRMKLSKKLNRALPFLDVSGRIPDFGEYVRLDFEEYENVSLPPFYFPKHSSSLVIPKSHNILLVISREKKSAIQLIKYIQSKFEELSIVSKDFGLELDFFIGGQKLQEKLLTTTRNVERITFEKPKNDFEKEVIKACRKNTDSLLSNVNVYFKEPQENSEYDILITFTPDDKIIIEPTDYERLKRELPRRKLKQELILRTSDSARLLGAKAIVVAKGFPAQTFSDIKKIADSRGVVLLNEEDYELKIGAEFLEHLLPRRMPVELPLELAIHEE